MLNKTQLIMMMNTEHIINADEVDMNDQSNSNGD